MDYLGWELERQRAALRALLGGGETEERDAGNHSAPEGESPPGGTRRSPAGLEAARRRGAEEAGRYAGGHGEAGGALVGAPGAWEMVQSAAGNRLAGESGGPEPPLSTWEELLSGEAEPPVRGGRGAETGASPLSRRYAPEKVRKTPPIGTGGAAELSEFPGRYGGGQEEGEAAAGTALDTGTAARTASRRHAGRSFVTESSVMGAGGVPPSEERPGGGEAVGGASAIMVRREARPGPSGGGGFIEAGQEGQLSRALPWGGGWESAALRVEDSARALSRAVQRDARRYDGGFTIY